MNVLVDLALVAGTVAIVRWAFRSTPEERARLRTVESLRRTRGRL